MSIVCTFDSKIFHNPMNKYCIFRMKTEDTTVPNEARGNRTYPDHLIRFTAVGYELPMTNAVKLILEGDWEETKYGMQFLVEQWREIIPETESGIYNYLSSGLLKGIGARTAAEIVATFGVNTLNVIERHPEKLLRIRGITKEKLEDIKGSYAESRTLRNIMTLLAPFKLTPKAALRIYKHLGPTSLEILQKSPYSLCRIPGFGFARVDAIMQKNDCDLHDPMRVQGALFCALDNAGNDGGHLFVEKTKLVDGATTLLNGKIPVPALRVKKEEIEEALNSMVLEGTVVCARDNIYHPRVFAQEDTVAQILSKLLIERPPCEFIQPILEKVKADFQIRLSEKQEVAVNEAFRNNLSIITGSPGTGKTTVLKTILEVYRRLHPEGKIRLMAPTGRASRNMAESTGYKEAKTMHNILGLISEEDDEEEKGPNIQLNADLIIVDEFSMVDMWLAYKFFSQVKKGTKLVLVGDPDQLPSVRPGNVFREMIASGIIPVTVLDQIFRQSKDSFIAHNAKIINRGETTLYYGDDFQFINAKTQEETAMIIMELYCQEAYEHGVENVQILSPFRHKGDASSDTMNATLREIINPFTSDEDEIRIGGTNFRVGDRIMQNKNTEKVSNGDLGFIRGVDNGPEKCIEVDFGEDRKLKYRAEDMSKLELAYKIFIKEEQAVLTDLALSQIGKEYRDAVLRDEFSQQIADWEEISDFTDEELDQLIQQPGLPDALREALDNHSSYWETYWDAISGKAYALIRDFRKKIGKFQSPVQDDNDQSAVSNLRDNPFVMQICKQDFDAINTAAKEHRELFLNGDKFIIRPFKDWFDILKESREQKHAVAAFAKNRYGIGLDYLFAMRKADDPETPYITLEFLPDGRLSQCRKQHCKPVTDADELAFVEEFRTKILLPYIEENA